MLEDNDDDNGDDGSEVVKARGMMRIAVCGHVCIAYASVCNLGLVCLVGLDFDSFIGGQIVETGYFTRSW